MKKADRNVSLTSIILKPDPKIGLHEGKRLLWLQGKEGHYSLSICDFSHDDMFLPYKFQFLFSL